MPRRVVPNVIIFLFIVLVLLVHSVNGDTGYVCENVLVENSSSISVRMVKKCHPNYTVSGTIARNCENWPLDEDSLRNLFLFLPVTSFSKNLTYWNMYCALCNMDDNFEFWYPLLFYILEERCNFNLFLIRKFELDSKIWWRQRRNNLFRNWYSRLMSSQSICDQSTLKFLPRHLFEYVEKCDTTSDTNSTVYQPLRRKYCEGQVSQICPKLKIKHQVSCAYGLSDGQICTENQFLWEGINFAYGQHGDIFLAPYKKGINRFSIFEYSNETDTDGIDLIYLCGKTRPRFNLANFFTLVMYSVSIFFLILYLILYPMKRDLRNLPQKTLYSYCLVQTIYSFHYVIYKFGKWCVLSNLALLYIRSSGLLWTATVVFEFASVAYYSVKNQKIYHKSQTKRYLIYCLVCWVSPAVPIVIALLPMTEDVELYSCPDLPVYALQRCYSNWATNPYLYVAFKMQKIMLYVCCIIDTCVFFAITWAFYNLCSRASVRSTSNTNLFVIFIKVAYTVSFYTIFKVLSFVSPFANEIFNDVYHVSDSFQGTFIFFAFYFERAMLTSVLDKFKKKKNSASELIEMVKVTE